MVKELEVVNIIPRILSIGEIAKELFKEINKKYQIMKLYSILKV